MILELQPNYWIFCAIVFEDPERSTGFREDLRNIEICLRSRKIVLQMQELGYSEPK